jgi:hypothetical protein
MDELRQAWERDGYVVLRGAAPTAQIAAYAQQLADARDGLLVRGPGDEHVSLAAQAPDDRSTGVVDPYALSDAARALLLSPELVRFLARDVFGDDAPLLFDATEAAAGPPERDGPYRDATYTALASEPESLVTATVALEGATTLTVFPGSHTIATAPFSGRYPHHNPERDGDAALQRHREQLAAALGDEPATDTITLDAGDVALWSAGLVHTAVSGHALVAHLCPAHVRPAWFAYRPERARHAAAADGTAWIATQHYDLADAVALDAAPAEAPDEPQLERIEDALREHDAENALEAVPEDDPAPRQEPPPSQSGRRGGGLLDSVRGLMNRRGRER